MASEHEHRIFHSGATEDPIVPVCSECGKDLMVLYMEQGERLAAVEQMAARGYSLVERFAQCTINDELWWHPLDVPQEVDQYTLLDEARAYLAQYKGDGDGK